MSASMLEPSGHLFVVQEGPVWAAAREVIRDGHYDLETNRLRVYFEMGSMLVIAPNYEPYYRERKAQLLIEAWADYHRSEDRDVETPY